MKSVLCLLSLVALVFSSAPRATASTAADKAWVGRCMAQLAKDADKKSARIYCACMHDFFEDNEAVTQSDMEHMYPPAHRLCRRKAGWR